MRVTLSASATSSNREPTSTAKRSTVFRNGGMLGTAHLHRFDQQRITRGDRKGNTDAQRVIRRNIATGGSRARKPSRAIQLFNPFGCRHEFGLGYLLVG